MRSRLVYFKLKHVDIIQSQPICTYEFTSSKQRRINFLQRINFIMSLALSLFVTIYAKRKNTSCIHFVRPSVSSDRSAI